jgi:3',5'-cyclic AMP phosphodiesterase CpdA
VKLLPALLVAACTTPTALTATVVRDVKPAADGHAVYFVGGDSRGDDGGVLPWAFQQARAAGARGFFFLGDMEWSRGCDAAFKAKMLEHLAPVPLFPVIGNHEVQLFGFLPRDARQNEHAQRGFARLFLDGTTTPVRSVFADSVVYSVDLEHGLHFIALDNVSGEGFGARQKDWLRRDLEAARADARTRYIVVGMHRPLAGNCTGSHSMADSSAGVADSDEVLRLLADEGRPEGKRRPVDMILASHVHHFAQFRQAGIPSFVSGGLGARLVPCRCGDCRAFHHVLQLDVSDAQLGVSLLRFPGRNPVADSEIDEDEGQRLPDLRCGGG